LSSKGIEPSLTRFSRWWLDGMSLPVAIRSRLGQREEK
jgi:hypothetical protein